MNPALRERFARSVERAISLLADYWILLTLGGFVAFVLGVIGQGWEFWSEQTYRDGRLVEIKTDRARIIQQVGVVLLAVPALIFAVWRSWTAHQQARASLSQVRLVERAQFIDRYQKGAQMLDSERLSVRLAGVYALQDLAAVDRSGHLTMVLQLLSGFV